MRKKIVFFLFGLIACIFGGVAIATHTGTTNYNIPYIHQGTTNWKASADNQLNVIDSAINTVAGGVTSHTASTSPHTGYVIHTNDAVAPAAPTVLTATGGFGFIHLEWTNPTDSDLASIEVWKSTTNDRSTATAVVSGKLNFYDDGGGRFDANSTRYYWVRAKDFSGNYSDYEPSGATSGVSATTVYLDTVNDIQNTTIDLATKVQGLLPEANLAGITSPAKLVGTIIEASHISPGTINSSDMIVGRTIIGEDIATDTILAENIYSNQITAYHIGANEIIANTANIATGIIRTAHIYDATITDADIGDLSADKITAGTITIDGTPALNIMSSGQVTFNEDTDVRFLTNGDVNNYWQIYKNNATNSLIIKSAANANYFSLGSPSNGLYTGLVHLDGTNGMLCVDEETSGTSMFCVHKAATTAAGIDIVKSYLPLGLKGYTSANEPSCNTNTKGMIVFAEDAASNDGRIALCTASGWIGLATGALPAGW